ncbi:unnamed protein product [Tilletia controversa]|uniref:Uncharacterized protein n=1 Tax=Tilletia caries TaxID=13290 RepID=A0ABN7J6K5_9BASI|nr:hypothetical protein CF328_g7000 [Tilletia controversa]CAD6915097.1 unnamed protein product [Tilletia caries]CAD6920181.1 unnamed protein product [Tilletia controversa]CAD6924337.1 unnamed protein product [Tilletia controversa]CAD6950583.1 unnamed protein product [Tilletia caries]
MESRRRSRRASSVTDNTASAYNISTILKRRAAPAPSFPSRCAAHLINLILKHGQNAGRDEIFPEPRAFVSLLHRSKPTQKALMAARESVGIKSAVPPTAMEVRCDSTLAQAAAAWAAAAGGLEPALLDTIKILNGFKDVSDHLQGRSFPIISAAAEGYIIMNKGLEELRAASTLTPWGTEAPALFDTRLTEYREHLIDTFVVQWATVLDPSMKAEVIRADGGNDLRYM